MKSARLILALYILAGSLIPQMDYSQFSRLPNFVVHYLEHKDYSHQGHSHQDGIWAFFYQHFINPNSHHAQGHEEDHKNLPFQTLNSFISPFVPEGDMFRDMLEKRDKQSRGMYTNVFHLEGMPNSIFHPPATS